MDSIHDFPFIWEIISSYFHFFEKKDCDEKWQRRFMEYCTGMKTLPITYDPFFKRIFHPDISPGRLSRFLSSVLGRKVRVVRILPAEEYLLDGGALLIMDMLVELEDGSLVNCEIQKVPYLFPGERMSCYSSDLVLRQYSRVKGERGSAFKYSDMKPVYTIVIYEKSSSAFHEHPGVYIHHGRTAFDTGLEVNLLQEYWLIALDVFRKIPYPRVKDEQTAWLALLATEDVEEAAALAAEYPWLAEIYREMEEYLHRPEEVLNMFSEALRIMDQNTVQYMIEEQMDQIVEQQEQIAEQMGQIAEQMDQINRQQDQIAEQKDQINRQQDQIGQQRDRIGQQKDQIVELKDQVSQQKDQIGHQQHQIDQQQDQIDQQQAEIARLKKLLTQKE